MSFRTTPQPAGERPHVEIRGRKVQVAPLELPPNAFATGANSLLKAVTDQKAEEERAARAADPWNGMRQASPFAGMAERVRGFFGLGVR